MPCSHLHMCWPPGDNNGLVIRVADQVYRAWARRYASGGPKALTEEDVTSTVALEIPSGGPKQIAEIERRPPPLGMSLVAAEDVGQRLSLSLATSEIRITARGHSTLGHEPLPTKDGMLSPAMVREAIEWISTLHPSSRHS